MGEWRQAGLALLLVAAGTPASSAPSSPFLDAAAYLERRGPDDGDCLSATYKMTGVSADASERSFTSCRSFIALTTDGATIVHDFALERVIVIEKGRAKAASSHAVAYARRAEMQNRRRMRDVAGKALSPVRQEADLQTPWAQDEFLALDRRREARGDVFSRDGDEIARVVPGESVAAEQGPQLRRALYLFFGLHPAVADAVASERVLPTLVSATSGPLGQSSSVFILKSRHVAPATFPLTASMALSAPGSAVTDAKPGVVDALRRVTARGLVSAETFDALLAVMERRLSDGDAFGAWLSGLALMWTHEQEVKYCDRADETPRCARFRTALVAAVQSDDRDMQAYAKASEAETRDLAVEGLDALDSIEAGGREDGWLLGVLRALLLADLREKRGALDRYADPDAAIVAALGEAIAVAPAMTSVLYDAGVELTRRSDTAGAWVMFDAARAMPHFKGGLVDRIDGVERANRRVLPYLFN